MLHGANAADENLVLLPLAGGLKLAHNVFRFESFRTCRQFLRHACLHTLQESITCDGQGVIDAQSLGQV